MTSPNPQRKLFFGLFVFPLLIAVAMAVLLCSVVLLTYEKQTPESLVASIKTGAPGKRWQKAYELSHELNQKKKVSPDQNTLEEIISILGDKGRYDAKTRGYMALALAHFDTPQAKNALLKAIAEENEDVQLFSLWSLGVLKAKDAIGAISPLLKSDNPAVRKMAAYVLGVLGSVESKAMLKDLLSDPAIDVRWNAALALAQLGDTAGLEIILSMLDRDYLAAAQSTKEDDVQFLMINAIKGLSRLQNAKSVEKLVFISQNEKNLKVRQAAYDALKGAQG